MKPRTMKYRVEWMHNGNWRMALNGAETFTTKQAAETHLQHIKKESPNLKTRIVEVQS